MDSTRLIVSVVGLLYVGTTIYIANQEEATGRRGSLLRWLMYLVVAALIYQALTVATFAFMDTGGIALPDGPLPQVDQTAAMIFLGLSVVIAVLCGAIITTPVARLWLRRVFGKNATYNPDSSVHMTAVVLSLAFIAVIAGDFVLGGGLSGLAAMIEATGISVGEIAFNGLLWIVIAFLGVGFAIRRDVRQTLVRLGLRIPTAADWRVGIVAAIVLILIQVVAAGLWQSAVGQEQFAEQTVAAEQIGQAINNLALALAVAFFAAVGEEILFRGAVQPVFGLIPTSILFSVIHLQYTLTPAAVLIVAVALVLGWMRIRYSTTAAIIAHFLYNLIPLTLVLLQGAQSG